MNNRNSTWITIVLVTVILMLIFLVFYGNRGNPPSGVETPQTEGLNKNAPVTPEDQPKPK